MHFYRTAPTNVPQRKIVRWMLLLSIGTLIIATLSMGGHHTTPITATVQAQDDDARLIFMTGPTNSDIETTRTPNIVQNIDYIESLPFDGMVVDVPVGWQVMEGEPLDYNDIYDEWLTPLENIFQTYTHNFLRAQIMNPGDVFDDEQWEITVQNWRLMARAAREAGFVGIFLDNEEYYEPWFNYPEDYNNPPYSLEAYQAQTQLRGRQIMEAVVDEFPDIDIIFLHGPYVSEPATPEYVIRNQVGIVYELSGPFFVGFVEGAGDQATIVDGGEVYQYRTEEDFQRSYDWRKYGMVSEETDSAFIPDHVRDQWEERVSISYGLYNQTWPTPEDEMNPAIMQDTVTRALQRADDYVWFYAEGDPWFVPGGVSQEWIDAVRTGRDNARSATPEPTPTPPQVYLPMIQSVSLINADTDEPIAGYEALSGEVTLDLATLPTTNLSLRANTEPAQVGSVQFAIDGAVIQTENHSPYVAAGDTNGGQDILPMLLPAAGTHTVTVTPYTQPRGQGEAGSPLTFELEISS
ncbi:MAG: hypothetical protein GFH27_549281n11 [Chloroflexi bacterium AL-W]|nr:hypothetical protein [Chloroflexi bacterium AL-N1]NOK65897.1 hypothetical protein [Chloroflexi bacterium AL-N10]NOK72778.1 hypothetical protein [Chloroflexi bacterium AL-N5]NOK79675.1 hypothetical protein [Chloroflexi bacterium AL-W]NOK93000.1 hypothetical protein [Chloroflexi bacterium AL-N15]